MNDVKENVFNRMAHTKGWRKTVYSISAVEAFFSFAVMILVFSNALCRYTIGQSFIWIEEILLICALWMYFMGGVLGAEEESHIKGDLISSRLKSKKKKKWLQVITYEICVITSGFILLWAIQYCIIQTQIGASTAYLHLPKGSSQYAVAVGMLGMFAFWLYHFLRNITSKPSKLFPDDKENIHIKEDEVSE